MTRKDYIAIAGCFDALTNRPDKVYSSEEEQAITHDVLRQVALGIATVLRDDNPHFDHGRFLLACGVAR